MSDTNLEIVARHVTIARRIVGTQMSIVAGLKAAGRDTSQAENLMVFVKRVLASFEEDLRNAQSSK